MIKKKALLNMFLDARYTPVTDTKPPMFGGAHRSVRGEGVMLLGWEAQDHVSIRDALVLNSGYLNQAMKRGQTWFSVIPTSARLPLNTCPAASLLHPQSQCLGDPFNQVFLSLICFLPCSQVQLCSSSSACIFRSPI